MQIQTPGIVLDKHQSRGADLILAILTREFGKISAVARGARSSKKRFFGGLDVFSAGKLELREPRKSSNLFTLNNIEERQAWPKLRENLLSYSAAASSIEVCQLLTGEEDPDGARFFSPLFLCLKNLNSAASDNARLLTLTYFIAESLEISGLGRASHIKSLSEPCCNWLEEMRETRVAKLPERPELLGDALNQMRSIIEEFSGRPLNSIDSVFLKIERQRLDKT